ncbi:arrestin (or S-antigen), N-terminal domain protein [Aspergillus lucknowensis]|uniref:Arrestin-like N-terminal domain-containing protein n=1 Tax=Aspergillus lucknowensis TaxID=176173 RepID=A0ABR4LZ31_9EURO
MAASILSRGSRATNVLSPFARPQLKIDFTGQRDGNEFRSYTTGDRIEGTVTISGAQLISFDEVDIKLEGTQTVSVERGAVPGRAGATQTFLRLRQPIEDSCYPTPRVVEPGRTYELPFTFVVPRRLLPHVCSHSKKNTHIERSHTLLPPSLGDNILSSDGKSLLDDMSPDMARVTYHIRAEVLQKPVVGPAKSLKIVQRKIRIVPAVEEEPPLTVLDNHPVYCVRREKDVKRGTMRPRQGRLVAAASQPKPLQLNPPSKPSEPVSTAVTVHLRFDPVSNEEPPHLGSIWSKLRASTYFAAHPWEDYPNSSTVSGVGFTGDGVYDEAVPLSNMCVASAKWTKHTNHSLVRRDSLQSTSSAESITGPSACFSGDVYYTASLVVPVTLPATKAFIPTFHSCLISRVYTLELCISYHTPNMNILTPTVSLKLPIQLTSTRSNPDSMEESEEEITQEEVDAEFFTPRGVAPPAIEANAPPGYSDLTAFHRSPPSPPPGPQIVPV